MGGSVEHLVNSSEPEKRALRDATEHEIQRFLGKGGKITVIRSSPADADRYRGCLWHEAGDGRMTELVDPESQAT